MPDKINQININGTSYDIQDNVSGYITGINAADVSSALGYTPYNATNPNGYVNTAGAATAAPVQSVNGQTGTVVLNANDVGALPSSTSIPSKISDLTNDQVYDLGVLNLVQLTSFVLTQEQHTTIAQMWNRGLCAVTFRLTNDSSTQYLAFKQFMGSLYDSDDNIYVFSGATVGYHFVYNPSTGNNDIEYTSGTIALGVMADAPYGAIAYMPDVTEDNVRTISHSEIIDTAVLQVNNKSPDNYGEITLKTSDLQNDSGYITGISSTDVTTALGYTPYDSTNPSGYVTASGAASAAPVQSVNSQTGAVTLSASDVGALPSNTVIPTKTSDLTNDSGFITTETDPTVPSWAKASTKPSYTASEVGALPDTTVIPSKTSDLTNDSGFITGMTILSYGSSTWQDFLSAYNSNQVIYCRASSNSNPASGSQTRLAFMAYVSNATSPTNVEFQYYRSMSSHTATQQGDEVYVYKLTSAGAWTVTVRKASPNIVAGTGLSRSYSNDTVTLSLDGTIPTKTSDLTNDSGFITTETDPTVPSWAKASTKPSYTASEVGALPDTTTIPTKISDLTNDQVYNLGTKTLAAGGQISLTSEEQSDILAMWNRGACAIRVTISDQTYMLLKEQDITYFEIPLHLFSGTWVGFDVNNDPISRKIALAVSTLTNYPIAMYAGVNDVVTVNGQTGIVNLNASDVDALSSDTDIFKVKQSVLSDEEDSWHTILVGDYEQSSENNFHPLTTNAWAFVHKYFSCQPSTGTIRANIFKGGLNGTISSDTTAVTQTASDNSTKVATTAFVKSQGYLTLSDLPIWDGSVT